MSISTIQKISGQDIILLLGAPLSGKGTQGQLLSDILERPCVSTGDLFRSEIKMNSILGQQIEYYMNSGELIPNELTTMFLTDKLNDSIYNNGMILDGYPRSLAHIPIFEKILACLGRNIFIALYFDVAESQLDHRRTQRKRFDDDMAIFKRRYLIFREETLPVVEYFESRNQLIRITCNSQSPEEIHRRVIQALENVTHRILSDQRAI
jgi:adenylate kinase